MFTGLVQEVGEIRGSEPYVYSQYTHSIYSKRYGASRVPWLTGAATWAYYAATQYILGIRPDVRRAEVLVGRRHHQRGSRDDAQQLAHARTGFQQRDAAGREVAGIGKAVAGLGETGVAFGRDLTVSYRVWSPRSGYPGHAAYRDFHRLTAAVGRDFCRAKAKCEKCPLNPYLPARS